MEQTKRKTVPVKTLQEYLQVLAEPDEQPTQKQWKLLSSYAELQYELHGGGKCTLCGAAVRHILPAIAEHDDGTVKEYACLCTRCLQAERAVSEKLTLKVGRTTLDYSRPERGPKTRKFRALR